MVKSPDTCVLRDKENLSFLQDTIPRTEKIASALLHAVCTCEFIPCSQSNEGCVTRFISRANSALELRSFLKFLSSGDDVDGLGAIMRGIPKYVARAAFIGFGKCVSNKLIVIFSKMTLLAALLINTKMETVLMRGGLLAFSGDDSFSISRHRRREYDFAARTVRRRNCGKRSA